MASKLKFPRDRHRDEDDPPDRWWSGLPVGAAITVGGVLIFIAVYLMKN